jgi:hypothetical protein
MPKGNVKAGDWDAWWEIHRAACLVEFNTFNEKGEAEIYRWQPDSRMAN